MTVPTDLVPIATHLEIIRMIHDRMAHAIYSAGRHRGLMVWEIAEDPELQWNLDVIDAINAYLETAE